MVRASIENNLVDHYFMDVSHVQNILLVYKNNNNKIAYSTVNCY